MLCDAAEKVGLDRQSVDSFLRSSSGLAEIRAAQTILRRGRLRPPRPRVPPPHSAAPVARRPAVETSQDPASDPNQFK